MDVIKIIAFVFGVLLSSVGWARSSFCIQNQNGLNCWYQTEADCEMFKKDHEFCVINPMHYSLQEEKDIFLHEPKFSDQLCLGIACIKYTQQHCTDEEERRDENMLKCESNN